MTLILWSSSGLTMVAGAVEVNRGNPALGVGLIALGLLIGPVMTRATR